MITSVLVREAEGDLMKGGGDESTEAGGYAPERKEYSSGNWKRRAARFSPRASGGRKSLPSP